MKNVKTMLENIRSVLLNGTTAEIQAEKQNLERINEAIDVLEEAEEYKKLGTLDECQEAIEKTKAQKPTKVLGIFGGTDYECKSCGNTVRYSDEFCKWCGQKQDWEG